MFDDRRERPSTGIPTLAVVTTDAVAATLAGGVAPAWWRRQGPRVDDLLLVVVVLLGASLEVVAEPGPGITGDTWWRVGLTVAVAVALWWRRRRPVLLAGAACLAVALGASLVVLPVVLVSLAVRRRDRVLVPVAFAAEAALLINLWSTYLPVGVVATTVSATTAGAIVVGLPVAVGAYVGARRDLVVSLRERAERAEAEQQLRAEATRLSERTRIAREMHDVLGHRISLVVLHAGGLEVNPGMGPQDVERSAALIRTTARQALEDLREVLGVLRAEEHGLGAGAGGDLQPQPTLADVDRLVHASSQAGVAVRLRQDLPAGTGVPPMLGRTAYRVVQEGLTNVHKHAPGASATVRLWGAPGGELEVTVTNARAVGSALAPPLQGTGFGLVGLAERVKVVGGSLTAGRQADGGFAVRARLPWPAQGEAG